MPGASHPVDWRPVPGPARPFEPPDAWSVSDLTEAVRQMLSEGLGEVWVRGEVSQPRRVASGHLYFTLKDAGAVCPAVMWRSQVARLAGLPQDGDEVLVRGALDVYAPHGRYQLIVREIHALGLGALQRAFEALRRRLEAEGLFAPEHKRPLPAFPRRIALVTSRTGAAVRDLVSVIRRRYPPVTLLLRAVRVQGEGAAAQIAEALAWVDRHGAADVIVVGRGGGSIEDLWAFNEEVVARAIAACRTPVVSAVGHEHDVTIADLVADRRAATPSQAGELVVPVLAEVLEALGAQRRRLARALRVRLDAAWQRVEALAERPALGDPRRALAARRERLEHLERRLQARSPLGVLRRQAERLAHWEARLAAPARRRLERAAERVAGAGARLAALSPLAVLRRGYSITRRADGTVLRRVGQAAAGEALRTVLEDGEVESRVERVVSGRVPEAGA